MYSKSEEWNSKRIVPTGLGGTKANEVLRQVIGQMSDGKWENYPAFVKYWTTADIDDNNNIVIDKTHTFHNGWLGRTDSEIRTFFIARIQQLIKDYKKYLRDDEQFAYSHNLDDITFLSYNEKISESEINEMCRIMSEMMTGE